MEEKINQIKSSLLDDIKAINNLQELADLKSKYLGKNGFITELTSNMRELSVEEKKKLGMLVNEIRSFSTSLITEKEEEIKNKVLQEKLKRRIKERIEKGRERGGSHNNIIKREKRKAHLRII